MQIEAILQLTQAFRDAVIRIPKKKYETSLAFADFPHGCCDDATQLLAAFLSDHGHDGGLRTHGTHGGNNQELLSHVWLSLSGLTIDITADQFHKYNQPPVIATPTSDFHQTFKTQSQEPADFRVKFANDFDNLAKFSRDYEKILRNI